MRCHGQEIHPKTTFLSQNNVNTTKKAEEWSKQSNHVQYESKIDHQFLPKVTQTICFGD